MRVTDLIVLAAEGVEGLSPDHLASKIAVPLAIVIFCGAVFLLLWSNYGWRKGGLIYGTAAFGFTAFIGVFWWFGAPGTPVATGLQNFPGQAADEYQPKWFPFEDGSARAEAFTMWESFHAEAGLIEMGEFQTVSDFTGYEDPEQPMAANISGDLDSVSQLMIAQFMPRSDGGGLEIGASLRTVLTNNTPPAPEGQRFVDWVTEPTEAIGDDGQPNKQIFVGLDNGQRVAAASLTTFAVFEDGATGLVGDRVDVLTTEWFAFKDPGALWLPSAVWTLVSLFGFLICLFFLDRIEQRDKREELVVEEAMDIQVPIYQ
jgi:hypothetical protein